MKILWITNIALPEASVLINEKPSPFGGWLVNSSKDLSKINDVNLSIASPYLGTKAVKQLKGERINYYMFSQILDTVASKIATQNQLQLILNKTMPDIVHIYGTEYEHSLLMINLCNKMEVKTIVSIQGLVSIYSRHYLACLPMKVQVMFSIRDLIKRENLLIQKLKFAKRGELEKETIREAHNVIGRTTWDKACTYQINPQAKYNYCSETLREEFYKHEWNIDQCEQFSIFTSQATYPIKGVHFVIEALSLIIERFPKTKLYIAGHDITQSDTLKQKLKLSSYAKYLKKLIKIHNLKDSIIFTGVLNEEQMCQMYLRTNAFVCPSSIENSPNSLGEAMILGVPCVASWVGGVQDMLQHNEEGFLYQHDAPYMLAYFICEIFGSREISLKLSINSRKRALITHSKDQNTNRLLEIYHSTIDSHFK